MSKLLEGEIEKLLKMEDRLHERVVGQGQAIGVVSNAVRRSRAGLSDPNLCSIAASKQKCPFSR